MTSESYLRDICIDDFDGSWKRLKAARITQLSKHGNGHHIYWETRERIKAELKIIEAVIKRHDHIKKELLKRKQNENSIKR